MAENTDPKIIARIAEEGLGPYLRSAREASGVSLRSISDHTRIRTYYLEHIEKGAFDRLPAGPVGLGFVRAFADAVGVDLNVATTLYERETTGKFPLDAHESMSRQGAPFNATSQENRIKSAVSVVAVSLFLLASGGLLWFMKGKTSEFVPVGSIVARIQKAVIGTESAPPPFEESLNGKEEGGNAGHEVAPEVDGVENVDVENAVGEEGEEKAADPSRSPASTVRLSKPPDDAAARLAPEGVSPTEEHRPALPQASPVAAENPSDREVRSAEESRPVSEAENAPQEEPQEQRPLASASAPPLTLKIFAKEDTWLRVKMDKDTQEDILLQAGNEKNWRASESFALTVGNVAGTQVSLNGTDIPLPSSPSNVLRDFVITKKSLN